MGVLYIRVGYISLYVHSLMRLTISSVVSLHQLRQMICGAKSCQAPKELLDAARDKHLI